MNKIFNSPHEALSDISDGASIALSGFFTCGCPTSLTQALADCGAKDLTIIAMSMGVGNEELNLLFKNG